MVLRFLILTLVGSALGAQSLPGLRATPKSLDFAEGKVGTPPPGWALAPDNLHPSLPPVYKAEVAPAAACNGSKQCAIISSLRDGTTATGGFLYQMLDAIPHHAELVTFRAAVRAEVAGTNVARLLLRIHDGRGKTVEYGKMSHQAITSNHWTFYELQAAIPQRAVYFEIGLQLDHLGAVWLDNVSLNFSPLLPRTVAMPSDEEDIRTLITSFAEARNAGDGNITALNYSEQGEYLAVDGTRIVGREALARMWTAGPYCGGQARRTIRAVDFVGANIAAVRVRAEFESGAPRDETFLVVRDEGWTFNRRWKIKVHEAMAAK